MGGRNLSGVESYGEYSHGGKLLVAELVQVMRLVVLYTKSTSRAKEVYKEFVGLLHLILAGPSEHV